MGKGFRQLGLLGARYRKFCTSSFLTVSAKLERHSNVALFTFGLLLVHLSAEHLAYAGKGSYGQACDGLLQLVEGTFGALLTAAAGIGAIVASAVGGFKMAWTLVVVSIGSFILRAYIGLFNGSCGG
jgi:hypothetical protein